MSDTECLEFAYTLSDLARSGKLPTGLYILLALISFFSFFFIFIFNDLSETRKIPIFRL